MPGKLTSKHGEVPNVGVDGNSGAPSHDHPPGTIHTTVDAKGSAEMMEATSKGNTMGKPSASSGNPETPVSEPGVVSSEPGESHRTS